jgi:proline iminopeptidase
MGPFKGEAPLKVLLLHGGPGFTHQYLEAMESFLPEAGIEMYYYDQLGCGNSDRPDDPALWTRERYREEVEEVRVGLGLEDFVLYGQSWGGMLSIEYALKYQQHLRGLVISNMTAGIQAYLGRLDYLKGLLGAESRAELERLEAAEDYDNPEYQRIMMEELYPQCICRTKPWPEPVTRAFRDAALNVYNEMQGKSEFVVTGNFKDWERWDDLPNIKVKTLTIGAAHDTMDPSDLQRMAELMPNAESLICPNGSHLAMWDDQAHYFEGLLKFLKSL